MTNSIIFVYVRIVSILYRSARKMKRTQHTNTKVRNTVAGVTNKQVQTEGEKAQRVCSRVQIGDVKLIHQFEEQMELSALERTAAKRKCMWTVIQPFRVWCKPERCGPWVNFGGTLLHGVSASSMNEALNHCLNRVRMCSFKSIVFLGKLLRVNSVTAVFQ